MSKRCKWLALFVTGSALLVCGPNAFAQTATAQTAPTRSTPRPWKVSFDGSHGELSGKHSDQGEYKFGLEKAITPKVKVSTGVDQHDRFDELDTQLILGSELGFVRHRSLLTITYVEGFGAEEASRHDIDAAFSFQTGKHVRPEFEYEYEQYIEDLFLSKVTAGLAFLPSEKLQGELKLVVSNASGGKGGTAGTFGISYAINGRVSLKGGGGYGHQHFLAKSTTEVKSELTALGLSGEVDWSLPHHNSVNVGWEFADRKTAYKTNTLKVGWSRSF